MDDYTALMQTPLLINLFLAFIEGIALIISPCILPLLPLLLAGSLLGSRKYPLGIIAGFIISFALFSLFAKKIVQVLGLDLELIKILSFSILIFIGIIMMSDYLSLKFSTIFQKIVAPATTQATRSFNKEKGFFQGLFFGCLLGLVWTPCAGPILAAVLVQTVLAKTTLASFLTLLVFGIGVGIPLLLIVYFGRAIVEQLDFFKKHEKIFRKILGIFIIVGVILMIYAEQIIFNVSQWTKTFAPKPSEIIKIPSTNSLVKPSENPAESQNRSYPAPPIEDIAFWINTKPIDLKDLRGKVVLLDFWTYSCINCIRTLPYLNDWYQKYRDKGLVILGIHTPEFEFEKKLDNVKAAVQNYGIQYPVLLDNNYTTWRNYRNRYWPASYLIDQKGQVVYNHFGEGNYTMTEDKIRSLLGLPPLQQEASSDKTRIITQETPETYLGYERSHNFASPKTSAWFYNQPKDYRYPDALKINDWALTGNWTVYQNSILANAPKAGLKIHFRAGKVFAVMGSRTGKPIVVYLDYEGGASQITVQPYKLYELLDLKTQNSGVLELISSDPGLEIFTFTFGS